MEKILAGLIASALAAAAVAGSEPWSVTVDPSVTIGPIRPMNAVNGGPTSKFSGTQEAWRQARIPFGRTHDMNHSWEWGGPNTIDVDRDKDGSLKLTLVPNSFALVEVW